MDSEKVYPISEKKLLDLRKKGRVPHSKLAARMFTLGVLTLFSGFFKTRIRRVLFMLTEIDNQLDSISFAITEATITLITISLLLLLGYSLFSLFETKFLVLPYGWHKEGVRKIKNPITFKTELLMGILTGPLILVWAVFSIKPGDYLGLSSIQLTLQNSINIFGIYAICLAFVISIINKLNFRLTHKMSKEEIIQESLEGEMSLANRRLINKTSSEL